MDIFFENASLFCISTTTCKPIVYRNQLFKRVQVGDKLTGYVKEVRPDGKVDVTVEKQGYQNIEPNAEVTFDNPDSPTPKRQRPPPQVPSTPVTTRESMPAQVLVEGQLTNSNTLTPRQLAKLITTPGGKKLSQSMRDAIAAPSFIQALSYPHRQPRSWNLAPAHSYSEISAV